MLKTKVKASSITNLTDARYFAAMGVEWLGFDFNAGADRYIQPVVMKAIKEWVDGVKIVGEFDLPSAEEIETAGGILALDAIQVGMLTPPETLMELGAALPIIKEVVVEKDTSGETLTEHLALYAPLVQVFLLNFDKNSISWENLLAGKPISVALLRSFCEEFQVILSVDLRAGLVGEVMNTLPVFGLNVQGGREERVGYKSFDELDEILEVLQEE